MASNKYAERGTYAHKILEECFDVPRSCTWDYEGDSYPGGIVDEEDIFAVIEAIDWLDAKVKELTKKYGGVKILKEVGFDLSRLHPDLWGTSDIVIYTECLSFLGVYDYKHGKKLVKAEENVQLQYYGLGAVNFLAHHHIDTLGWGGVFRELEVGIIQPRAPRKKGTVRLWSVSHKEVDSFATLLKEKAEATVGSTSYETGDHCYWCTAKAICPKIYNKKIETAQDDFRKV